MKKLLLIIIVLSAKSVFGQNDSLKLYQTFILHTLIDANKGVINFDHLVEYKNVRVLQSKGFKNLKFLSISVYKLPYHTDDKILNNVAIYSCNYVVAYDIIQDRIYELKGFTKNDFKEFYMYEVDRSSKIKANANGKLTFIDDFINKYNVEGLDLVCLYNSVILHKKDKGCSISCRLRDENALIGR